MMLNILRAFWWGLRPARCDALWRRNHVLSNEIWHCTARFGHALPHKWRAPK